MAVSEAPKCSFLAQKLKSRKSLFASVQDHDANVGWAVHAGPSDA
jgi:hypothetical protein